MKSIIAIFFILFGLPVYYVLGDNLTVTGTASVNELDVNGLLDARGNTAYFGTVSGTSSAEGMAMAYSDGAGGANAALSSILTRPLSSWNWLRSGSSRNAMSLNFSNQLVLTGTQASSPGSIVLDPSSNQITVGGSPVLINGPNGLSLGGNIGINSSSPSSPLVVGGYLNGAILQLYQGWNGTGSYAEYTNAESHAGWPNGFVVGLDADLTASVWNSEAGGIKFGTSGGESMRITANGYVGIGTQTPSSPLVVSGYINGPILQVYQGWNGTGSYTQYTNAESRTGWPNGFVMGLNPDLNAGVWNAEAGGLIFGTNNSEGMRITTAGYVGIGTSSPQARLDVNGAARLSGTVAVSGSNSAVLINPQGDLSMGAFASGPQPQ